MEDKKSRKQEDNKNLDCGKQGDYTKTFVRKILIKDQHLETD